jgi:phosphatidate cytidylyltransferase
VCGLVFYNLRLDFGLYHVFWLISVVIITDVAGYFTGKMVGGPKVFPKISPNKTWSGVIGGWLAVGLFSLFFVGNVAPPDLFITFVVGSVLLSFAAQIGDIIQSRLKRVREVKDSSNLLPGHGGFMDRLDGFIGATVIIGPFFQWIIQ